MPDVAQTEAPGRVDGAVLVDDDLDGPGAAEEVDPFARGGRGGVGYGDAADRAGVAVCEGSEGDERFLGDCERDEGG